LNIIIEDLQPLSIVNDAGFNKIFNAAWPDFEMAVRLTINQLETLYNSQLEFFKNELRNVDYVALTSDGYTAKYTNQNYDTITIYHYKSSTLKSKVLNFVFEV
jgi:hypothetical protein